MVPGAVLAGFGIFFVGADASALFVVRDNSSVAFTLDGQLGVRLE